MSRTKTKPCIEVTRDTRTIIAFDVPASTDQKQREKIQHVLPEMLRLLGVENVTFAYFEEKERI